MAKLTLSLDQDVITQAKRLVAEQNTSVSAIFRGFICTLAAGKTTSTPLGRLARRASGLIPLKGQDRKNVLADSLQDKHRR